MGHWNYRIVRSYPANKEEAWYSIREVYYDNNGKVNGWTENAIAPESNTIEGLLETLQLMLNCLDKPVLDEANLEECDGTE